MFLRGAARKRSSFSRAPSETRNPTPFSLMASERSQKERGTLVTFLLSQERVLEGLLADLPHGEKGDPHCHREGIMVVGICFGGVWKVYVCVCSCVHVCMHACVYVLMCACISRSDSNFRTLSSVLGPIVYHQPLLRHIFWEQGRGTEATA